MLVYYVGKVFTKVEMNYLVVEKYLYDLIILVRKFHPYNLAHDITILIN